MKRNNQRQAKVPDLILTSDWHLREDTPVCRTDNFWEAQWGKVTFIRELEESFEKPIKGTDGIETAPFTIHAGDFYHHWKPSPYLLSETIRQFPVTEYGRGTSFKITSIFGQHDLPQHNFNLERKSGLNVLMEAGIIEEDSMMNGVNYGQTPPNFEEVEANEFNIAFWKDRGILVWHKLIWEKQAPHWSDDPTALEILKQYPQYDLIVTGDNHSSFVVEHEGRLLVNPGSLTRQTADQVSHKPRVYLWYAETNTVEPVYLPIETGVISREHLDKKQDRDRRLEAFVESLDGDWEADISFEKNLEQFEKANDIPNAVMEIVRKVIEV